MNILNPAQVRVWWHSVDRLLLALLGAIMLLGIILIFAASPAVATRIHLSTNYFVVRHVALLVTAIAVMLGVSMLSIRGVRQLALIGFPIALGLTAATLFWGVEIKGATRWLQLPGFSLQPSEFVKPLFAVLIAWLFAKQLELPRFPSKTLAVAAFFISAGMLLMQPDVGMTFVLTLVWMVQFFLAGLPWLFVIVLGVGGLFSGVLAYLVFPHFASRIDRFLDPSAGDTFQINRALDAFSAGGWLGTGPGEGTVKMSLPDAHADFIFAVAGEELGFVCCLVLLALYLGVIARGLVRAGQQKDVFILLSVCGIITQFGLQAIVNMASSMHLIPTKGMTLPFISYGGSSLLAMGLGMGIVLALTRQAPPRHGMRPTMRR